MADSIVAGVPPHTLTPRERECIALAGDGLTAKEIGRQLGIGHRTVQNYQQEAARKLDVRGTARAAKRLRELENLAPNAPVTLPPAPAGVAASDHPVVRDASSEPSSATAPAGRMVRLTAAQVMLVILAWVLVLSICFALVTSAYLHIRA